MKTKFFGISAKLALTILAISGALFTSCYDSVDGDVTPPYEAPAAIYCISGTVTDVATGLPIDATVTINGKNVTLIDGMFFATSEAKKGSIVVVGANTVNVTATNYTTVNRTVNIAKIEPGQSVTYVADVALESTIVIPVPPEFNSSTVTLDTSSKTEFTTKKLDNSGANDDPLNLSTNTNPSSFERYFTVDAGYKTNFDKAFETAPAEIKAGLISYAKSVLAPLFGSFGEYKDNVLTLPYTISLPAYSKLNSVTIKYQYTTSTYKFTYEGADYTVTIKAINNYFFDLDYTISATHQGHAHGGAHGNSINAGGGIISGDM